MEMAKIYIHLPVAVDTWCFSIIEAGGIMLDLKENRHIRRCLRMCYFGTPGGGL